MTMEVLTPNLAKLAEKQAHPSRTPPPGPSPVTTVLSTIQPEEVRWLWEPYLPCGKVTILQGDPGCGKTYGALNLAARFSRDGLKVVYGTLEDGLADTIRPRLDRMGANLDNILAFEGRRTADGEVMPCTLEDVSTIEAMLRALNPAVLVLDPISAWLGASARMNLANEVRGRLAPLVRMAETLGTAVLLIQHLTKAPTSKALYRGQGSVDFTAAARSVLLLGKSQDGQQAMAHIKSSLGPEGPSLGYQIGEHGFEWTGEVTLTAGDLLEGDASPEDRGAMGEAMDFLEDALAAGPCQAGEVYKRAAGQQISKRTLARARASMGVIVTRHGFQEGSSWELPPHSCQPSPNSAKELLLGTNENSIQVKGNNDIPIPIHANGKALGTNGLPLARMATPRLPCTHPAILAHGHLEVTPAGLEVSADSPQERDRIVALLATPEGQALLAGMKGQVN
jgi:hypothetical protein